MKKGLILILTILSPSLFGQTIKDFYLPVDGLNRSNYYSPDPKTGTNTGIETKIWFIKKDKNFDIMEAKLYNGEATSITTETVILTDNEVKITKTVKTNAFETNKQKTYSPYQTKLKLPTSSKKEVWTYTSTTGDKVTCSSELIDLRVKGELRKAIKVTNEIYEDGKIVDWATTIDFYVKGFGLYKRESAKGELLEILSNQTYDNDVDKL